MGSERVCSSIVSVMCEGETSSRDSMVKSDLAPISDNSGVSLIFSTAEKFIW